MRILQIFIVLFVVSSASAQPKGFSTEKVTFKELEYTVVVIDPKSVELKLYWKNADGVPFQTLSTLREAIEVSGKKFLMATNSGIYATNNRPLGLHVEGGKTLRPLNRVKCEKTDSAPAIGNFCLKPNGVFFLTRQGAHILETEEYFATNPPAIAATQSGPQLLIKGEYHPAFRKGSLNTKVRSGVGINDRGHVVFAISNTVVNFYDFAQFFKEKLRCNDALYLDGTISSLLLAGQDDEAALADFVGIWAAAAPN